MNQEMEQAAAQFDAEEVRCVALEEQLERSHTVIGRGIARARLALHRGSLEQATGEYELAELQDRLETTS